MKHKQISLRFPVADVQPRLQALLPYIEADEGFRAVKVSESMLLREIMYAGLDLYERRYGIKS